MFILLSFFVLKKYIFFKNTDWNDLLNNDEIWYYTFVKLYVKNTIFVKLNIFINILQIGIRGNFYETKFKGEEFNNSIMHGILYVMFWSYRVSNVCEEAI